jgi:hypothetical protein
MNKKNKKRPFEELIESESFEEMECRCPSSGKTFKQLVKITRYKSPPDKELISDLQEDDDIIFKDDTEEQSDEY